MINIIEERLLNQVATLSTQSRTTSITLFSLILFSWIVLVDVVNADFYTWGRNTSLPIIGVNVSTKGFFWAAPILITAIYVRLQLQLRQLSQAIGSLPPIVDGARLERVLFPSLYAQFLLSNRRDGATTSDPLAPAVQSVVLFIFWIAPLCMLAAFWWRSATARDEWLSLSLAGCFFVAAWVGAVCWRYARSYGRAGDADVAIVPLQPWQTALWGRLVLAVLAITLLRTETDINEFRTVAAWAVPLLFEKSSAEPGGQDPLYNGAKHIEGILRVTSETPLWSPLRLVTLAHVNLSDANLTPRPKHFREYDFQLSLFREEWCADAGKFVCNDDVVEFEPFRRDWRQERISYIRDIERTSLSGADLRYADLRNAFAPGINLSGARLDRADLSGAHLEGAEFVDASLAHVRLDRTRLQHANFSLAKLDGAKGSSVRFDFSIFTRTSIQNTAFGYSSFIGAEINSSDFGNSDIGISLFDGAVFYRSDISAADFTQSSMRQVRFSGGSATKAHFAGANFAGAEVRNADLRDANFFMSVLVDALFYRTNLAHTQIDGSNASSARFIDTRLVSASLRNARLRGVAFTGSRLHEADLTNAEMLASAVKRAIGDEATKLPDDLRTGEQITISNCYTEKPRGYAPSVIFFKYGGVWRREIQEEIELVNPRAKTDEFDDSC